ncbi:MAG: polyisoprenoid-binding protein YceI [Crocinitomix sp.]|jgi:polyisoprenoid-binding protein YceI
MIKKIIIGIIVLVVIGVAVFLLVPWGEYESKLEKSDVETEVAVDSTGNEVPSLSLIQGEYSTNIVETQAELLFDVDGLKQTKGAFERFVIDFTIGEDYHQSTLSVNIESASLNTGNGMRDEHLVDPDFFDVEKYPSITFLSTSIEDGDTSYVAKGDLTLLSNTKPIDVPFKHLGNGTNKTGQAFEAFEGSFVFDRVEYGMEEVSGAGNVVTVDFYCELMLSE